MQIWQKKGADLTTFGQEKKGADLTKKGADLTKSLKSGYSALKSGYGTIPWNQGMGMGLMLPIRWGVIS